MHQSLALPDLILRSLEIVVERRGEFDIRRLQAFEICTAIHRVLTGEDAANCQRRSGACGLKRRGVKKPVDEASTGRHQGRC